MKTTRSLPLRGAAVALVASAALSSSVASAQPLPAGNPAVAEALFQQARELFKQESYAEACPKFAESQRLEPKLGTLLNLAVCDEKLGKIATAWAEYTSAATIAGREGRKEREDFARERVAALEKKLARVTLQMSAPPAGLRVTLDDQAMDPTALNTPLPIDPGKHRIAAKAPGKIDWSTTIDVPSERADLPVPIPALEAAAEPAPPPIATAPAPAVAPPAPVVPTPAPFVPTAPPAVELAPTPARNDTRFVAYAGFGVGAAGVLVGAITGGVTLARAGAIRDTCRAHFCDESQADDLSSTTTLANVSNVSFAVGALGVGVGVVGLLLAPSHEPATKPAVAVTPMVGPGVLGVRGTF